MKTNYTDEQINEWKEKAKKWDALDSQIEQFYSDEQSDDEGALLAIGEYAAIAFGYL